MSCERSLPATLKIKFFGRRPARFFDQKALLATLRVTYPACTTFCVGRHPVTFLGSTPERLAKVDGRRLNTAALAGSAPRSSVPEVDDAIGQGLLTSPKERSEHAVVVKAIDEALSGLGVVPEHPPEPTLLRLHGIQHLHTPIRAEIRPALSLLELSLIHI